MKIINVIPLSRGIFKETLSYFSSKDISIGSIVSVPIRKKIVNAIVISKEDTSNAKAQLKSSTFAIKKIESVKTKHFFTQAFTEAAKDTAEYFSTTTGSIIQALTPKQILEDLIENKTPKSIVIKTEKAVTSVESFVFQADDKERITTYRSIIREEFAKKSSVFFCLPTATDIASAENELNRGIKEYVFVLHGKMTKKQIAETWNNILKEEHPILIISTGSFFSIPRNDIGVVILDKENSQNYKTFARPYFDMRTFAEKLAKRGGIKLIFGDIFLRPETIWRTNQGELIEINSLKFRAISSATQSIVDMGEYKKTDSEKKFTLVSDELKTLIQKNKLENANLFILIGRKGLATITICNDCGKIVKCTNCDIPAVLYKNTSAIKNNLFMCNRCGKREDAEQRCANCESWRLFPLGIGLEGVEEEIKKVFPDINIFKIDSGITKTPKKCIETMDKFLSAPGSILLGTQMALPYLTSNIDSIAAIGLDSLFSVPNFRIREKVFTMLLSLRVKALKNFLIQTRDPEEKVFTQTIKGNSLEFYHDEIKGRKEFGYPPFSIFIKITLSGKKFIVEKEMAKLEEILKEYSPNIYSAFSPLGTKGGFALNALVKLERKAWIDRRLLNILQSLPPTFIIQVDPIDLL